MEAAARGSAIQDQFRVYRTEIDAYNDRRERLIKASRDVTTQSKRLIFVLHRFPHDALPLSSGESSRSTKAGARIIKEATEKRDEIMKILVETALREGLSESTIFVAEAATDADGAKTVVRDGDAEIGRAYRHERSLGGGLEEFIEGVSFLHFLQEGKLISLAEVQAMFTTADGVVAYPVPPFRYLLGLSDLTGELMRFATNAVGAGDTGAVVNVVLELMRDIRTALDPFIPLIRDMRKKQQVTSQSMRKIEDVSYAIKVRSSEYGSDPAALQEMVRRSLRGGSGGGGEGAPDEIDED
ncbi:Translin [Acaromyces ingoldii]|uniref:Translin n=1 Tax=Acaromyces ingoldii TaxID=215250 RepID=A0A316YFF6_9BASI|nr:Translin [Acaromyces ingoldii]PWN87348.1 Translin [Acaromyces ingoldii]